MLIFRLALYTIIAAGLTGCAGMTAIHTSNNNEQNLTAQKESEKLWQDNKGWLLSKLPKTYPLARDIVSALKENSDSICSAPSGTSCDKLFNILTKKLSPYRLEQLPDDSEQLAILDGGTAYVFRTTDWTFSGIADLSKALYFTIPDVPLMRTDKRGFAFVANNKTDTETVWKIYRRNILERDRNSTPLGTYTITRAELDASGVPKQIDLLNPQQRDELELAKQGMTWRRRALMKVIKECGSKPEHGNASRKLDGLGGRGKHNRSKSQESISADSTTASTTTMTDALRGNANLNCNAGSGYVATEDGIAAEVYRLIRNKEGTDAIIAATAKEIPGGVIRYNYPVGRENFDILNPDSGKDMQLQMETTDGSNKLSLNLHTDTGASSGSLILAGNWYVGPGYRIRGKDISATEFATFFIRAYRDCAMKDSQGSCKRIPDIFISFINPLIAEEFVQYISDHYLGGAGKSR